VATTSTMTSPVPRAGSGMVSIASGDPKRFNTAAFIGLPLVLRGDHCLSRLRQLEGLVLS
jgi:hypothetical protein